MQQEHMVKIEQENRELKVKLKNLKEMRKQTDYYANNRSPEESMINSNHGPVSTTVSVANPDFS